VASDTDNTEDLTDASHGPRECMPCRGSGQVISNLGGSPSNVKCPWCGGSGMRVPGSDAQAGWPANVEAVSEAKEAGDAAAAAEPAS
jgi:DnaJ-class molecular chaperone